MGERDWTVVQRERCGECGLDAAAVAEADLAGLIAAEGLRWRTALGSDAHDRPAPEVWSPLEYACHVRDVFAVFTGRVARMLSEDEPELGWWDHEAAVDDERYNEQDPGAVLDDLDRNAEQLAGVLRTVEGEAWQRAGTRRGSERFTIGGLARFGLHESHHHRGDARGVHVAGLDEADLVGRTLAHGFSDDPVLTWVFPGDGGLRKLEVMFGYLARDALVPLGATWVTRSGDACASWTPPGSPEWPEERQAQFIEALAEVCDGGDLERLVTLERLMQEHHPPEPHWYLGTIAAVPASRGRGHGSRLLAAGLEAVERDGLGAYLESTNLRNVPLYERHGFRRIGAIELPDGPSLTTMWREP